MMIGMPRRVWLALFVAALLLPFCGLARADDAGSYQVVKTIPIGLDGRWDYAVIDDQGQNLYLTRTTHTIVVDTASGKVTDIPGGEGLHGVALVPAAGRGFITDGKGAAVIVFDLKTDSVLGSIASKDDSDGIIYDPASDHLFVACGDSACLIPIAPSLDLKTGKADPPVDLGGKPEFLASDGQGKIYVCLADEAKIAVVDAKAQKLITTYPTDPGKTPTGLSMDPEKGRLFIGCRNQKLIVMDVKDGSILADLPIGKGVDATAFNAGTAWASCGDGTLSAIRETSPNKFEIVQTVQTAPGARTMAIDPKTGTIYLPTAEMKPTTTLSGAPGRPRPVPGTFKVLVVAIPAK
jgi:DNA-binding beta-propeller fold protein YncE